MPLRILFLGVIHFALLLLHVELVWTVALTVVIGLISSLAFAALVACAQEVLPDRTG